MAKAKKEAEAPAKDRTVLWIGISAGLAALMAVGVVVMASKAEDMKRQVDREIKQYEQMKTTRKNILDLRRKGVSKPKVGDQTEGALTGYLSKEANNVGLPASSISFKAGTKQKSGGWEESPITADISASKDGPILHGTLVNYLSTVEKNSVLKSKNLTLNFKDSDFNHVTILFSSFRRE